MSEQLMEIESVPTSCGGDLQVTEFGGVPGGTAIQLTQTHRAATGCVCTGNGETHYVQFDADTFVQILPVLTKWFRDEMKRRSRRA